MTPDEDIHDLDRENRRQRAFDEWLSNLLIVAATVGVMVALLCAGAIFQN